MKKNVKVFLVSEQKVNPASELQNFVSGVAFTSRESEAEEFTT